MVLRLQEQADDSHPGNPGTSRISREKTHLKQGNYMICNTHSSPLYSQLLLIAVVGHWSPVVMYYVQYNSQMRAKRSTF